MYSNGVAPCRYVVQKHCCLSLAQEGEQSQCTGGVLSGRFITRTERAVANGTLFAGRLARLVIHASGFFLIPNAKLCVDSIEESFGGHRFDTDEHHIKSGPLQVHVLQRITLVSGAFVSYIVCPGQITTDLLVSQRDIGHSWFLSRSKSYCSLHMRPNRSASP